MRNIQFGLSAVLPSHIFSKTNKQLMLLEAECEDWLAVHVPNPLRHALICSSGIAKILQLVYLR